MKSIHILPTDKPSILCKGDDYKLYLSQDGIKYVTDDTCKKIYPQHVYITSNEYINDVRPHIGKWHLEQGHILNKFPNYLTDLSECKLVIMTTDPELIKDGVQEIDNSYLKWYVQNENKLQEMNNFMLEESNNYLQGELVNFLKYIKEVYTDQYGQLQICDNGDKLDPTIENVVKDYLNIKK